MPTLWILIKIRGEEKPFPLFLQKGSKNPPNS